MKTNRYAPRGETPGYMESVSLSLKEQKALAQISQEITAQFFPPPPIGRTQIVLMVVNPYCVHAYWSIRGQDLIYLRKQLTTDSAVQLVLRFYDLTNRQASVSPTFDVTVDGDTNRWYVDLWASNKRYAAELGFMSPASPFKSLARSNTVETPRADPTDSISPAGFLPQAFEPHYSDKNFPLELSTSREERTSDPALSPPWSTSLLRSKF